MMLRNPDGPGLWDVIDERTDKRWLTVRSEWDPDWEEHDFETGWVIGYDADPEDHPFILERLNVSLFRKVEIPSGF